MTKKVLVVEDDPGTARFFSFALESEDYQVINAVNGLEGLKKAQAELPDLMILDVMLPGLDGFEVCHRLRGDSKTADIPILMISAKAQDVDREMGLKLGANQFLTKPIGFEEFIAAVKGMLT